MTAGTVQVGGSGAAGLPGSDPVVAWRLEQVEDEQKDQCQRLSAVEGAVNRMWGAVALACVLIPVLTTVAVALVVKRIGA